jgi:hypothetical protein
METMANEVAAKKATMIPHCARLDETVAPSIISDVGGDWS